MLIPRLIVMAVLAGATLGSSLHADVFELRTYTTNEGKLDALNARFRDHTVELFRRHGIESVGYWTPTDEERSQDTLIYVLRHKSRDAAKASWKAFFADAEWKKVAKESQRDGRILAKAPESVYMETTDYSPNFDPDGRSGDIVFELRTYRTPEGRRDDLDTRFRDHTVELFTKHGMQSVAYWHPITGNDAEDTLIYVLRHQSREAAKASWKSFVGDPAWQDAFKKSRANGPLLRESPESVYMRATDYSAIK